MVGISWHELATSLPAHFMVLSYKLEKCELTLRNHVLFKACIPMLLWLLVAFITLMILSHPSPTVFAPLTFSCTQVFFQLVPFSLCHYIYPLLFRRVRFSSYPFRFPHPNDDAISHDRSLSGEAECPILWLPSTTGYTTSCTSFHLYLMIESLILPGFHVTTNINPTSS